MFKRHLSQAFCEDIAKLVLGVNLNQLYFLGLVCHVLPEPMVLYCIMLGTRSESSWFHLAQGQSSNVVLMNAYVYVGYEVGREAGGGAESFHDGNDWKEIAAGCADGNVFSFHG